MLTVTEVLLVRAQRTVPAVLADARERRSRVQAGAAILARVPMALFQAALADAAAVQLVRLVQRQFPVFRFDLHVKDAALEAGVQRQIVRQRAEIVLVVAAYVQDARHIHCGQLANRLAADPFVAVDGEPGVTAVAADGDVDRFAHQTLTHVHRALGENAPRARAQIPSHHNEACVFVLEASCNVYRVLLMVFQCSYPVRS